MASEDRDESDKEIFQRLIGVLPDETHARFADLASGVHNLNADGVGAQFMASVITLAAIVDVRLEEVFRTYMTCSKSEFDSLIGPHGPLGTFSGKIRLAVAMRLVPPHAGEVMHEVRKLRNDYAHKSSGQVVRDDGDARLSRMLRIIYAKDTPPSINSHLDRFRAVGYVNGWLRGILEASTAWAELRKRSESTRKTPST